MTEYGIEAHIGAGGKWQISSSGGTAPRWSRTGHDLLYQSGGQIMAASYTVKGDTSWPRSLGCGSPNSARPPFDVTRDWAPDGKRAAVLAPMESVEAPKQEHEIVMLQNFFDELRRKVPLGK